MFGFVSDQSLRLLSAGGVASMSSQGQPDIPASLVVDGNLESNDVMFCADTGTYYTILTQALFMIKTNYYLSSDPATGKCTFNFKSLVSTKKFMK